MSVKRALSILALLTLTVSPIAAQEGFERTFGGPDQELGYSVEQTFDRGFVICGSTASFGAGSSDIFLIRTNAEGDEIWSKTYGGSESEIGYSVQQTPDRGFIIAGFTYSYGAGNGDVYLVRTDFAGDTLWTRTYGGSEFDWGYSVDQTSDGGYIIAGSTTSFGAETGDAYAIRTDSLGITVWARGYGGHQTDYARSVEQTTDGGFILAGTTYTFGTASGDLYIIKTDASGAPEWTRTFGQDRVDEGNSVTQTYDGGYIVAGETYSSQTVSRDIYLVRLDASGDSLWTKTFGGFDRDVAWSVRQTADAGYIVAGFTESSGAGDQQVYLLRTDSLGDTLWTRTYGGPERDSGKSVGMTIEGGYVIGGDTESYGQGDRDLYLIKTDENGYVGIESGEPVAPSIPRSFVLRQNFPNPFNPSTTIAFEIPGDAGGVVPGDSGMGASRESDPGQHADLTLFDLRGRRVKTLIDSILEPGYYRVTWDGKDDTGRSVPSGIYLYRLRSGGGILTRKMTIAK